MSWSSFLILSINPTIILSSYFSLPKDEEFPEELILENSRRRSEWEEEHCCDVEDLPKELK